jgi:transposase
MDVHWRRTTICILDENGRRVKMLAVRGAWAKVLGELARIRGPWEVCFEASCGYGWLYERLKRMAQNVVVAHPGQLRLIFRSKRKSDRVDAEKLAKLLYLDEVPTVYVPSVEVRGWRALIEHRQKLLAERVRAKNGLRALLRTHGVQSPQGLWTKKGLRWIRAQEWPTRMDQLQRDLFLERLESLGEMIGRVEKILEEIADRQPGVRLLMDIPGVGIRTAEAVMAYVDDPHRFGKIKSVGSYFGLVPCQDQSAERNRLGHITRQGPATVRKLLTEATWQGIRRSPKIRAYFERVRQGNPERQRIALVATAHHLLRVMLAMLRTGELWRAEAA